MARGAGGARGTSRPWLGGGRLHQTAARTAGLHIARSDVALRRPAAKLTKPTGLAALGDARWREWRVETLAQRKAPSSHGCAHGWLQGDQKRRHGKNARPCTRLECTITAHMSLEAASRSADKANEANQPTYSRAKHSSRHVHGSCFRRHFVPPQRRRYGNVQKS